MKLNSLDIENNICSRNIVKTFSDFTTNFPVNMFLFGVRKNICTAPFLDAQELHSWSTLKANVCIFLNIYFTLSLRNPLSYRNQSIDLLLKSMDWFLYDNGLRNERVK